ncbi:MAG: hypothetical protein SF182_07245 [Deltaproteobacteria bacterium]|nr:hypothetical protein [Deltaproteobacteria bacterium]
MRFADDHCIPALRGMKRPPVRKVRSAFARRAAWLERKCEERVARGLSVDLLVDELAAIAVAVELLPVSA